MNDFDAVVVGGGHNGLVAANLLADAGWAVLVAEATGGAGGAVRSAELTLPGWVHDEFSAFYPLAAASPVLRALRLEEHGLRWSRAPVVTGHVLDEDRAVLLHAEPADTAAALATFDERDGATWMGLCAEWEAFGEVLMRALFTPFPPVRAALHLGGAVGGAGLLRLARRVVVPLDRWTQEEFHGRAAPALLAGAAMHTDLGPADAGSAMFGWLLCMLGQRHGFPVPAGGAARLTDALVARLRAAGGCIRLSAPVARVLIRGGTALGVELADGSRIRARKAVLADVAAPLLYRGLVEARHLPDRLSADLERFTPDLSVVKVDWACRSPLPWRASELGRAGTVHLGGDLDHLRDTAADLRSGRVPKNLYAVLGQMNVADPSRSPAGTETAWAYAHLPRGRQDDPEVVAETVQRLEAAVERAAPGFLGSVLARAVRGPAELQAANPNLTAGTMNGGTSAVHQQVFLRPYPGLGRADTPIARLFLAGSSAHPGGGVHGACGANAARAALAAAGPTGPAYRWAVRRVQRILLSRPPD